MLTTPPLHAAAHPLPRAAAWPFGSSSHPCPSARRRRAGNTSSHAGRTSIARLSRTGRASEMRLPSAAQDEPRGRLPSHTCKAARRIPFLFVRCKHPGAPWGPFHSAVQARHTSSSPLKRVRTPVARAGTSHPRLSSPARARRAQRAACHPRLSVPHSPSLPRPPPSRAFAHAPCGANARPTNRSHVRARPSSDVSRETSVPAV